MQVACSRLSDSGEDVKVKGMQKVGGAGKGKRKGEPESFLLWPFSAHFWHVWDNWISAAKLLKCQWVGIFLKFLARVLHPALIPYACVSNLECKKGVSRQHTTFTLCQNDACSNGFFLFLVDYALEWSTFWLSKCDFLPLVSCWGRERSPPLLSPVSSHFCFKFALSQFSGPDYLTQSLEQATTQHAPLSYNVSS